MTSIKKLEGDLKIDESTLPTQGMPLLTRIWYISQKFTNFIWRYRKNPLYLFTYLYFIARGSYKEHAHFMSDDEFIQAAKTRSTLRLQDGEFTLLLGTRDVSDEQKNPKLTAMWKEAISLYTDTSPYILGLPPYILIDNKTLHTHAFKYLWMPAKILYRLLFPKNPQYFNGSYFYIDDTTIPFMQVLSSKKNILLVSNKNVIAATKPHETYFFAEAQSVSYVETPDKNAFAQYEKIMQSIESLVTPDTVVFMACGASGKAMIYDLAKKGIRAHDIGNGLIGAYTGEKREHFLKWDIFGPLYDTARAQK